MKLPIIRINSVMASSVLVVELVNKKTISISENRVDAKKLVELFRNYISSMTMCEFLKLANKVENWK